MGRRTRGARAEGRGGLNSEEQIRAEIAKLDVVTAPRIAAKLRELLELWPAAASIFVPRFEQFIAAINEKTRAERQKWLQA